MTTETIVFMDMEHMKENRFSVLFGQENVRSVSIVLNSVQAKFLKTDPSDIAVENKQWWMQNPDKVIVRSEIKGGTKEFIAACIAGMVHKGVWVMNRSILLSSIAKEYHSKGYAANENKVYASSFLKPESGRGYVIEGGVYRLVRKQKTTIIRTNYDRYGEPYRYPITLDQVIDEPRIITL